MKAKSGESLLSGNIKYIVDLIITPPPYWFVICFIIITL